MLQQTRLAARLTDTRTGAVHEVRPTSSKAADHRPVSPS
jgi:hypothetical protein